MYNEKHYRIIVKYNLYVINTLFSLPNENELLIDNREDIIHEWKEYLDYILTVKNQILQFWLIRLN